MTDESILGDQTMNSSTLKKLSVSIPLVLMFAGICAGAEAGHIGNNYFCSEDYQEIEVGETREIEIMIPKPGFVGATIGISSGTTGLRPPPPKIPTSDKDYYKKYVRITVIEKRPLNKVKNGMLIGFRFDEIDAQGNLKMYSRYRNEPEFHEPLYWGYMQIQPEG